MRFGDGECLTVGIVKLRRIAIGGRDAKMDITAGRNGSVAQRGVAHRAPVSELVGTFHAQKLLDRRVDEVRMFGQLCACIGIP